MENEKKNVLEVYTLDYELVKTFENITLKEENKKKGEDAKDIEINYVAISPNQKYVVCGYTSGYISIFDYKTAELVKSFKAHEGIVKHIEFYEDKMLTCGMGINILIFDLKSFTLINEIIQPSIGRLQFFNEINFILVSNNMEHIYFGSTDGCIYKCDKQTNYKAYVFINPNDVFHEEGYFITSGIFSIDKKYIVYTSGYSIKLVNLETGKVEKIIGNTKAYINDVIFYTGNSNILVTWSEDGTITYWNIETEEQLISFSASNKEGYSHLAINKTGQYLASGNDKGFVNIWDAVTKHPIAKIKDKISMDGIKEGHKAVVKHLVFADENNLLTGSYDGTAKLWELTK